MKRKEWGNYMRYLFLYVALPILLITSSITSVSYGEKLSTFTDPFGGYSIQYPENWRCETAENVPILNPMENGFPKMWVALAFNPIAIEILKFDYEFINAEEAIEAAINSYYRLESSGFPAGFKLLSKGTNDDKTTAFLICSFSKTQKKRKVYVFLNNQKYYWFEYEAKNESFDKYLPQADSIMGSFKAKELEVEQMKASMGDRVNNNVDMIISNNEYEAERSLKRIFRAYSAYNNVNGKYPYSLDVLTKENPPYLGKKFSGAHPVVKGYIFEYLLNDNGLPVVTAKPEVSGVTGIKSYFVDEVGSVQPISSKQ